MSKFKISFSNNKFYQGIIVFSLYLILLLLSHSIKLVDTVNIRFTSFIIVVGGIIWGWPAAVGIFFGNLVADFFIIDCGFWRSVAGSLSNGFSALLANVVYRRLFGHKKNIFVHEFATMFHYICTMLITYFFLSFTICFVLLTPRPEALFNIFISIWLNNLEVGMLLGLPLMMFLPKLLNLMDEEHLKTYNSLKFRCFHSIIAIAMGISIFFSITIYVFLSYFISDFIKLWLLTFESSAIIISIVVLSFSYVLNFIEKNLTNPLFKMVINLRDDSNSNFNEISILSNKLDFAVSNSENISGNEYLFYVGLTTRNGEKSFTFEDGKRMIDNICLKYVKGCVSSSRMSGTYQGNNCNVQEKTLAYHIYGTDDNTLEKILDDILRELNQESILVEKNRVARWYYCRKK